MTRKKPVILVVEDLKTELMRYVSYIRELGYQVIGVSSSQDALKAFKTGRFDLVLTDIHLSGDEDRMEGLELIQTFRELDSSVTLMAMSFNPRFEVAERARQLGAWLFLRKPISSADELAIHIHRALEVTALQHSSQQPTRSPAMQALLAKHPEGIVMNSYLRRAVRGAVENPDMSVVLIGETGTGKEELARLIHRYRAEKEPLPFVAINCANLQGELMMSTLFGHKKGAFTGAVENAQGAVGQANGGILFLDEFHRLSLSAQERLLRVLQDGSYQRVGDVNELRSRFQLIASTSLDLEQAALDGTILMDLRMRLYGIEIRIPALRERLEDMPDLIDWFFAKSEKSFEMSVQERNHLIELCKKFYWQGNIRQLFGVLGVLVLNASLDKHPIKAELLPVYKTMLAPNASYADPSYASLSPQLLPAFSALMAYGENLSSLDQLMDQVEKAALEHALAKLHSVKDVCVALNHARSTLDAKRRKHGIL